MKTEKKERRTFNTFMLNCGGEEEELTACACADVDVRVNIGT